MHFKNKDNTMLKLAIIGGVKSKWISRRQSMHRFLVFWPLSCDNPLDNSSRDVCKIRTWLITLVSSCLEFTEPFSRGFEKC